MPAHVFTALVVTVIAAAGLTIALVWSLGLSPIWVGLGAVLISLAMRLRTW